MHLSIENNQYLLIICSHSILTFIIMEHDKHLDYILQSEKLHFHIRQLNLEESQFTTT